MIAHLALYWLTFALAAWALVETVCLAAQEKDDRTIFILALCGATSSILFISGQTIWLIHDSANSIRAWEDYLWLAIETGYLFTVAAMTRNVRERLSFCKLHKKRRRENRAPNNA